MQFFRKQWEAFKAKSLWGKFTDVLFIVFLIMMFTSDGRILLQRGILATGIFGGVDVNADQAVSEENWQWNIYDLEGERYSLEDFRGKPIFLNYWATWCPPCNAEMPYIIETVKESGDGVAFLLVTSEDPDRVKAYLAEKEWSIPVFFITNYPSAELEYASLPTTLVINERGTVIHRSEGIRKWSAEDLLEMLDLRP